MWFRQAHACVLGGLGGSGGGGCFLREGGDSPARGAARLPVLSPGLSLDPKPKVVRPKTKINFTKKVRCHSIPTLLALGRRFVVADDRRFSAAFDANID